MIVPILGSETLRKTSCDDEPRPELLSRVVLQKGLSKLRLSRWLCT